VAPEAVARIGVDVGGTFTDVACVTPDGAILIAKVRSRRGGVNPALWSAVDATAGSTAARALVHGTTVATNALIERRGGRVVLVATQGFEDILWLRRQERAALYDLTRHHPPPLVTRDDVIGVAERMGPDGPIMPLSTREIARVVSAVVALKPDGVAIALLFGFRHDAHEAALAAALRKVLPPRSVAASSEVLPVFREYERTATTVAEAFLRPVAGGYLDTMGREAAQHGIQSLRVMASSGGTLDVAQAAERAASLALSGPAGGVEGARLVGRQVNAPDLLTLDMGGTSADAGLVQGGEALTQAAGDIAGIPLALPHVLIETVGAGGGSIAWVDAGGALRVGPQSAGADPGPACYGQGGTDATVTDAALVLGWLDEARPLAKELALRRPEAERAVKRVADRVGLDVQRCAAGILEIATATMVRALRSVSVERGVDPRGMTLVPFGGAGPLFACPMADALAMRRVVIPPHAGVLSALGLATAPARVEFLAPYHRLASQRTRADLESGFAPLAARARGELPGAPLVRFAQCRYPGQGYELSVPAEADGAGIAAAFHRAHRKRFGHADPARDVEIVNLHLIARGAPAPVTWQRRSVAAAGPAVPGRVDWETLAAGTVLEGPLAIDGPDATARLEPGWRGTVHETGAILLERA
jgi:N-methylhydantoinase A